MKEYLSLASLWILKGIDVYQLFIIPDIDMEGNLLARFIVKEYGFFPIILISGILLALFSIFYLQQKEKRISKVVIGLLILYHLMIVTGNFMVLVGYC